MRKFIHNIQRILTKNEWRRFIFLNIGSVLASIADIGSLALLFFIINLYTPGAIHINIPFLQSFTTQAHYLLPAIILVIVFLLKSLFGYYIYKLQFNFNGEIASRISKENLLRYLEGNYRDHVNIDSAVLVRRIYIQPVEFANFILAGIQQIITESALIILSVTALFIYDAKLLLIVSIVLVPAIIILSYVTRKRLAGIRKNIQTVNEQSLQFLNEALAGYVESNIYGKNFFFTDRYAGMQVRLNKYIADMQITQGLPSRFFEAFAVFGLLVFIMLGKYGTGFQDVFTLGAFVAAAYKIIPGISKIINMSGMMKTYGYTVKESAGANSEITGNENNSSYLKLENIEFRDVNFSFDNNPVIKNMNFKLESGCFACVFGDSGKGKTTLMNLLLGFFETENGAILFNGKSCSAIERKKFWNRIAYVKQDPFILHDTIAKNIVLSDARYDTEKINHAAKAAGLSDFLLYDIEKEISQGGKNISGGQKQRIAVARALYKDADLIILDEPFNELDETSEVVLLNYFKQLSATGKMVILITHNSSSKDFCNMVIDLNEQ